MKTPNNLMSYMRHWNSPEKLAEEFGITCTKHPTLPLMGFKYGIKSPKFHPIVAQARGTVLEIGTWEMVACPFLRFHNHGEGFLDFNWDNFTCSEKVDGSLILVFSYRGSWHIKTSGSFGFQPVENGYKGDWHNLFVEAKNKSQKRPTTEEACIWNPDLTYIFELCSPYTKIVRHYPKPTLFLLGAYNIAHANKPEGSCYELSKWEIDTEAERLGFQRPNEYKFNSVKEVQSFLSQQEAIDPTWEGVVVRDNLNRRLKLKTNTYLAMHDIKSGGVFAEKHLIPIIMEDKQDELLKVFPEVTDKVKAMEELLVFHRTRLEEIWLEACGIETQKEFALFIIPKTPFSSILFQLRKESLVLSTSSAPRNNLDRLQQLFAQAGLCDPTVPGSNLILKVLFK